MPNPNDPAFRARLSTLDAKYAAAVPGLLQAIAQALRRCAGEGATPDALAALHASLHTVAGSAATFGFGELGRECRRLEQGLRQLMREQDDSVRAAQWPALAAQVAQLPHWAAAHPQAQRYGPPAA